MGARTQLDHIEGTNGKSICSWKRGATRGSWNQAGRQITKTQTWRAGASVMTQPNIHFRSFCGWGKASCPERRGGVARVTEQVQASVRDK